MLSIDNTLCMDSLLRCADPDMAPALSWKSDPHYNSNFADESNLFHSYQSQILEKHTTSMTTLWFLPGLTISTWHISPLVAESK
jgi:hypothetical protein